MFLKLVKGCIFLLASQGVAAAEKFYPIVGPDGSIQVIRSPAEAEKGAESSANKVNTRKEAPAGDDVKSADTSDNQSSAVREEASPALYDSDSYTDSEVLDEVNKKASKKRFYVIQDALGSQTNESADEESSPSPVVHEVVPEEAFQALNEEGVLLSAAEVAGAFPHLPSCVARSEIDAAASISHGKPVSIAFNRQAYNFLDKSAVVAAFRIGGSGPRTIVTGSFSARDRSPAFVDPFLVFLDQRGCSTRAVKGFHERLYPATKKRHPMLRASHLVHSEEAYVLVMAPNQGVSSARDKLFGLSNYGQFELILKK